MRTGKKTTVAAIAVIAAAVILYLGLNDPTVSPAPRCVFKMLTGWDCPGCGTQRAVHALLHGRVAQAWGYNAALFVLVPLAALYAWNPRRLRPLLHSTAFMLAVAVGIVAWWVGRNYCSSL